LQLVLTLARPELAPGGDLAAKLNVRLTDTEDLLYNDRREETEEEEAISGQASRWFQQKIFEGLDDSDDDAVTTSSLALFDSSLQPAGSAKRKLAAEELLIGKKVRKGTAERGSGAGKADQDGYDEEEGESDDLFSSDSEKEAILQAPKVRVPLPSLFICVRDELLTSD
jgi:hypothetical protein